MQLNKRNLVRLQQGNSVLLTNFFTHGITVSIKSEYRSTRALQICVVFLTTLIIERLLHYSRAGWIGFIVMMIYVGFDSGASIHRTIHRFVGSLLGLLLSYWLWQLQLLDFRIILMVIPCIIFLSFFSLCKFYAYPTIFTVTLTFLGTTYFNPISYHAYYFFFDYFKATAVAFAICMIFEGWVFKASYLTKRFYTDLQRTIITELEHLFQLSQQYPPNRNRFLRGSATCRTKIQELYNFEQTAQHDIGLAKGLGDTESFHTLVSKALHDIRLMFLLATEAPATLQQSIQEQLNNLTNNIFI